MKDNANTPLMVTIHCIAYNQETYIKECLDGFVMQKTNFRFEAIVHDDASVDRTASIIREYADKYPEIIKPIFETENQWSKSDGSLNRIMDEHTHGKYVAVCEGDDYWIDPFKLQKQFDFMESHPECSLCFHSNYHLHSSGDKVLHKPQTIKPFYYPEDIILGGGGFMATNAMFYRWEFFEKESRPFFWENCPIGDMPSMLYLSIKGTVGYIDEAMSVYRVNALGSWSSNQNSYKKRTDHYHAILKMYNEFDEFTHYKYHRFIFKKNAENYCSHIKDYILSLVFRLR